MKEFKSIGYNYWPIIIWVVGFCSIIGNNKRHTTSILINLWETLHSLWEGDYGFVLDNIYYVVGSLLFVIVVSVNVLIVDRTGIIKKLFLIPIVLKRKTWREIKYYVDVDEIYYGQYGKNTTEAIWFIGDNDKVCLRFEKRLRKNLDEVLKIIDKFETKNNNVIKISNPYFMRMGWTKIKIPETKA